MLLALACASPTARADEPPLPKTWSGVDVAHAGIDAVGGALWLQAAVLFPFGILDSYRDESDGHFARTLAGFAIQPIRIGTESIMELAAWRRYQGRRTVHALVAYAPSFTGWDASGAGASMSDRARAWAEGKSRPLYGFETRAPVGPWYVSHSRFLFATRESRVTGASGENSADVFYQPDVAFQFGQGFSRPFDWGSSMRLWPQFSLAFAWIDAWMETASGAYDEFHSTAFLAGPGLGWEWRAGVFDLRFEYALEMGPELQEHHFWHRPGMDGVDFGRTFRTGLAVRNRLTAGAGLTF